MSAGEEIAVAAAQWVVEEGLEYGEAKRKAAREWAKSGSRMPALPSDEQVEDEVREHLALYHAQSQPAELRALRELAALWLQRMAAHRPHLGGAVWRGTATALSSLRIDLYCDDTKAVEIDLINQRVDYDAAALPRHGAEPLSVLSLAAQVQGFREPTTVHLIVRDLDEIKGALKPDARGRSWRGDAAALARLLQNE